MTTDELLDRVRALLTEQQLFRSTASLVVAVSGGPDSLCLLHVLWRLRRLGGPALHVAHLDHGFRAEESAAEARFVAATAAAWDIPATIEYEHVPSLAEATGQNRQAAARLVRYRFLARLAQRLAADAVAVAHQAEDQAETLLLHLLHGTGLAGLRGMRRLVPWEEWATSDPVSTALLLRPLLDSTRAEIEAYSREQNLTPCLDPSNSATYYTRNRIRAELLPQLMTYNQHVIAALGRTAQLCADDYAYIQAELDALWPRLVQEQLGRVVFDAAVWRDVPIALQRYALRRGVLRLDQSATLSYEQVEATRRASLQRTGYQQSIVGELLLLVEHGAFLLIDRTRWEGENRAISESDQLPQLVGEEVPLVITGPTPLSASWELESSFTAPAPRPRIESKEQRLVTMPLVVLDLDKELCSEPLVVRRRRAGDRFRPVGGTGNRRVQDFFIDQKVPRHLRLAWPILASPTALIWIVGLRADRRFVATPATREHLWIVLNQR